MLWMPPFDCAEADSLPSGTGVEIDEAQQLAGFHAARLTGELSGRQAGTIGEVPATGRRLLASAKVERRYPARAEVVMALAVGVEARPQGRPGWWRWKIGAKIRAMKMVRVWKPLS